MRNPSPHGLSDRHLSIISEILEPYAGHITKFGLFGSRATGRYRPESDIDLVIFGDIDPATRDRIWNRFHESSLPFRVDLCVYDLVDNAALRTHIDQVFHPLFQTENPRGISC